MIANKKAPGAFNAEGSNFIANRRNHAIKPQIFQRKARLDFAGINAAALPRLPEILERWLPDGHRRGHEWCARNPCRDDRHAGSFSVNIHSGKWADFASGDRGGDVISLAAYLFNKSQGDAARAVAEMIGVEVCRG
jgi:hypothetical protein